MAGGDVRGPKLGGLARLRNTPAIVLVRLDAENIRAPAALYCDQAADKARRLRQKAAIGPNRQSVSAKNSRISA
jgi:hypothetical protein